MPANWRDLTEESKSSAPPSPPGGWRDLVEPTVDPSEKWGALTGSAAGALTENLPTAAGAYMGGMIGTRFGPAAPVTIPLGILLGGLAGYTAGSGAREKLSEVRGPVTGAPLMTKSVSSLPEEARPYGVAGEIVGGGLPIAAAPLAAAARGGTALAGKVGQLINRVVETAGARPLSFMGAETGALVGSGTAGGIAESYAPGQAEVRIPAEIAGGVASPGRILFGTLGVASKAYSAVAGRFSAGARQDAAASTLARVVEEFGEKPESLIAALASPELSDVTRTASQMIGSPALIALETKLSSESAKFGAESKQMADQSMTAIRAMIAELEKSGNQEALIAAAKMRDTYFRGLLEARLAVASQEAQRAAAKITSDTPAARSELSNRVVAVAENALEEARLVESGLWEQIPRHAQASADNILAEGTRARDVLLKEEKLPPIVEGFLARMEEKAGMPDQTTFGEIAKFRSRMLALARQAGANKQFEDARTYGRLAESAMDDMTSAMTAADQGTISAAQMTAFDAARNFSRQLHDTFTRTFVGRSLSTGATGARRTPPEVVLRQAFASGGERAALQFREMEEAAAFTTKQGFPTQESAVAMESLLDAQKRIIRLAAAETVNPTTGRVNPERLTRFVRSNEEVLNRFPEITRDLRSASDAERVFREVETASSRAAQAINQKALFSRLAGVENPAREIAGIINGPAPMKDLSQLIKLAQRSGDEAVAGLRASIFEYADRAATTASGEFSFAAYKNALTRSISPGKPNLIAMMAASGVVRPQDTSRYILLLNEAEKVERAVRGGYKLKGELSESSAYYDLVLRVVGAKIGAKMPVAKETGATLVAAGAGSRTARQVMDKIPIERTRDVLIEAAKKPELMAALLERVKTPGQGIRLGRQIHAYLWQAGLLETDAEQQ